MNKERVVESLIDKIVLSFTTNEYVLDIVKKLRSISSFDRLTVDNNTIRINHKNFSREIVIDDYKKEIFLKDSGSKAEGNKKSRFQNEFTYREDSTKYSITKKSSQNDFIKKGPNLIIENTEHYSIDGYNENKRVFYSSKHLNRKYIKNAKDEFNLIDSKDTRKDFYLLANGDVLKIVNTNGSEKYYYCDSSEMNGEDLKNTQKAKFNVELGKKDAKVMLENLNNAYNLINNDTIYGIRGNYY